MPPCRPGYFAMTAPRESDLEIMQWHIHCGMGPRDDIAVEPLLRGEKMIGLYSNRIGCLGSLVISIVATVLVGLLLRACGVVAW